MTLTESERYWDERARENALYYVDTQVGYEDPDAEAFWRHGEEVVDLMLGMVDLELAGHESVLDIGCGVGRLTRALAARAERVYGLDVSAEMLRLARAHNPDLDNVEWLHGDGEGLGVVADASLDGCFSHVVFQHIPDPEVTLNYVREMGRVLRPGGWALFQVSTDPTVHGPPAGLRARLRRLFGGGSSGGRDAAWHGSAVDMGALRAAAAEGGLRIGRLLHEGSQYTTVLARRLA